MRSLVQFSIKNPLLVNVIFVFIIVAGIDTVFTMQREAFPRFSFDTVLVTTTYPGATPEEIEKLITIPIEKELKEVNDVEEILSVSAEGISVITVILEEEADNKDRIVHEIQRAVDRAEDLPGDLKDKPLVNDLKTEDQPIIEVSLSGKMSETELRTYVKALEKKILNLEGVARVERQGFRNPQIWVTVNPEILAAKHISIKEIGEALKKQNRTVPGGKYYIGGREYIIRTTGEFVNAEDVKQTIVRASPLGNWIRVKDVAEVVPALEEETTIFKSQGTRSINLVVIKKALGDTIDITNQIFKLVDAFKKTAPPGLTVTYIDDTSFYIKRRQNILANNGLLGMIMVVISLFTFLSIRTAIAACIGIPTALFFSFCLMHFFGISFNLLSMFGLIMILGMLVDEDIVISENIYRHLERDRTIEEATEHGVLEVVRPLLATVLTRIAAFIPLLLMGGTMGKFVRHIPIVVTLTLLASLFAALVILPSHICDLNRMPAFGRPRVKKTDRLFKRLVNKYKRALGHCLNHRYLYTLGLLAAFAGTFFLASAKMKFILFPSRGIETFVIKVETEKGDSLEVTNRKIHEIEKIVGQLPPEELKNYTTRVGVIAEGARDPQTKRASHVGQIRLSLTPATDRQRDAQTIINDLREKTKHLTGFTRLDFEKRRVGPPVGKALQVRIRGDDFAVLKRIANTFKDKLAGLTGVADITDDYELDKDEIRVVVDPVKAAQTGLTVADIAFAVRNAFDGLVATTITSSEEEVDVVVKFPVRFRYHPDALENLLVPNHEGRLIRMAHVATFETTKGALAIKHHDGMRTINVTANINEKKTSALQVGEALKPLIQKFESDYPGIDIQFGGEIEKTQESLQRLFNAFCYAFALIVIILIAMFRSLLQPLVIILVIPFSIIGVALAFFVHGEPFSFMSFLGLVGLTGVVVDAGVIMIDFINRLRQDGVDRMQAITEGAGIRLRAVVLTSLTTFVGIIPAAYGIGGLDPFIRPMALALNYGILFGAFITIFYVPIFMAIVEDVRRLFRKPLRHLALSRGGVG